MVSTHFRTNDLVKLCGYIHYRTPQIWLTFGHASLNSVVPWPLIVQAISGIFRQIADRIKLRFGEQTHWKPPLAWYTFGHIPLSFRHFLTLDFSSGFHAFADTPLIGIEVKFGGPTYNGLPQAWLTFDYGILTISWPLIGQAVSAYLQTNCWLDLAHIFEQTHLWPPPASLTFVTFHWIPVVSWPLIGWAVSMHLQANHWSDLA